MMKRFVTLFLLLSAALCGGAAPAADRVDPAAYGAGEMKDPARTFYVSISGNDQNDGRTLKTAFRTVTKGISVLRAGDTLLIAGGVYCEPEIPVNVKEESVGFSEQCGKRGAPIRIMGMKGEKVLFRGGVLLTEGKGAGQIREYVYAKEPNYNTVQEEPSGIELQRVPEESLVRELPGTYFLDVKKKRLVVHFAALEQKGVVVALRRIGIRIHGSWIHLENLNFSNYYEGIYARMNRPYDRNAASHITITKCGFFNNYKNGVVLDGASWSLVKNNQFYRNTRRGSILTMPRSHDNLITGNWCGDSAQTLRNLPEGGINFAINNYGSGALRNHIVGNVMASGKSYRWKTAAAGSILRDNILHGVLWAESPPLPVVVTNNLFLGPIGWMGFGYNVDEKKFAGSPMKFYGNCLRKEEFKPVSPELAEAEKIAYKPPEAKFPSVRFDDLRADYLGCDSAVILWRTPECDGWGSVIFREKTAKKNIVVQSGTQGVRHAVGLNGLRPGKVYLYRARFVSRRGGTTLSPWRTFTTPEKSSAPRILEVGPGKMSLEEAACAALPGDTVKLLPGVHKGSFALLRGGTPEKPVLVQGRGAVIDAMGFHAPAILLQNKDNVIIDGVTFTNPELTARKGLIRLERCKNITVRNCRARFSWLAGPFVSGNVEGLLVENNVIQGGDYPISASGKNIRVLRNTVADATMRSTNFWSVSNVVVEGNIFYRPCIHDKVNTALLFTDVRGPIRSDNNVYWSPVPTHPVGGTIRDPAAKVLKQSKTLEEWRQLSGMDRHSIAADPLFVDYEKGDLRLKEGSPAKGKGASF